MGLMMSTIESDAFLTTPTVWTAIHLGPGTYMRNYREKQLTDRRPRRYLFLSFLLTVRSFAIVPQQLVARCLRVLQRLITSVVPRLRLMQGSRTKSQMG